MKPMLFSIIIGCLLFAAADDCLAQVATCADLSVTGRPSFKGLKSLKLEAKSFHGAEGGETEVLTEANGDPAYIIVSEFGETGKRVSLYELGNIGDSSFVARVSEYRYAEPIYVATARIVSVRTDVFIVCHGQALKGVGTSVDEGLVSDAVEHVATSMKIVVDMKIN